MSSRKRVSVKQMEILVDFLEGHSDLARGRLKSKEGCVLSARLWGECAVSLNAEIDGDQRTPKQWNKWFTDYKCRLLNRIKQAVQSQRGTGGGPGIPQSLSPLEERLANLLQARTEAVGRGGTPQNEVRINPLSPMLHSELLESTSPAPTPTYPVNCNNITTPSEIVICADIDMTPIRAMEANSQESHQEATAPTCPRNRRRRRCDRSAEQPVSELEASRQALTDLEKSRIEVERLVASAYNKMADATFLMAGAASKSADATFLMAGAASKSADAQCRIATALENISKTLCKKRVRLVSSSEEE